jgi:hypothetical protein
MHAQPRPVSRLTWPLLADAAEQLHHEYLRGLGSDSASILFVRLWLCGSDLEKIVDEYRERIAGEGGSEDELAELCDPVRVMVTLEHEILGEDIEVGDPRMSLFMWVDAGCPLGGS